MSAAQRFSAPTSTPCWSILPNEAKAEVVRNLDLASALALMRCGRDEEAVVRKFGSFDAGVNVSYRGSKAMLVELRDRPDHIVVQKWKVSANGKGSVVKQYYGSDKLIVESFHPIPYAKMAFSIAGRLMSDSLFEISRIDFRLMGYNGKVNLNLKEIIDVTLLVLSGCSKFTTRSILEYEMIETDSWLVASPSKEILLFVKQKLTKMCRKRELKDMITGTWIEPLPDKLIICPRRKFNMFFRYRIRATR